MTNAPELAPSTLTGASNRTARSRAAPAVALAIAGLASIYAVTSTWSPPYFVDAYTNAIQARTFAADQGHVLGDETNLSNDEWRGDLVWVVDSPDGPTSQYPPGVALWGALFYTFDTSVERQTVVWGNDEKSGETTMDVPSMVPAAVAAVAATTIAMLFLALTLLELADRRTAIVATAVAALGTGAWSIASNMLWQHGPAMMAISVGTYFAARSRFATSGVAFGFAILIRPHTALIAAAIGLTVAIRRRTVWPAVQMALTSALGLTMVIAYNRAVWGAATLSGGYGSTFTDRVQNPSPVVLLRRLIAVMFDPAVGVAMTSPVVLVAMLGVVLLFRRRNSVPDWALGAALGGAAYMVVQLQANRVSGGGGFFGYRYPLEALMAAAPLLVLGAREFMADDTSRRRILILAAGASVAMHAYGAITT